MWAGKCKHNSCLKLCHVWNKCAYGAATLIHHIIKMRVNRMGIFLSAGWIVNQSFRALECLFSLLTRCVCLSGKDPVCGGRTQWGVKVHYFTHKVSTTTDLYKKKGARQNVLQFYLCSWYLSTNWRTLNRACKWDAAMHELAPLRHSKKVISSNPPASWGFSLLPQPKGMHVRLSGDSQAIRMNVLSASIC